VKADGEGRRRRPAPSAFTDPGITQGSSQYVDVTASSGSGGGTPPPPKVDSGTTTQPDPLVNSPAKAEAAKLREAMLRTKKETGSWIVKRNGTLRLDSGTGTWTNPSSGKIRYYGIIPSDVVGHLHVHNDGGDISFNDIGIYSVLNNMNPNITQFYMIKINGTLQRYDLPSGITETVATGTGWMK
jgi:hypothetical protein